MKLLFILALLGASFFPLLTCLAASKGNPQQRQNTRGLRRLTQTTNSTASQHLVNTTTRTNDGSKLKGTIKVDFYRTFEEKSCLGFTWKQYSMPMWRLRTQMAGLNFWWEGRVNFEMGDVYEIEDESYSKPDCFVALDKFSTDSTAIQNPEHVSVMVVKQILEGTNGCATIGVPLGGLVGLKFPAIILGMRNEAFYGQVPGLTLTTGGVLAHEMGHIVGYQHVVEPDREGVLEYSDSRCGLNIRYPRFSNKFPSDATNDGVWDPVTGERYEHSDWQARTNMMGTSDSVGYFFLQPWRFGLFRYSYEPVFDAILECFFLVSTRHT